jgi:adenylate cyclase
MTIVANFLEVFERAKAAVAANPPDGARRTRLLARLVIALWTDPRALARSGPLGRCAVSIDLERQRLAALLVADVVGFARLMHDDERRTVAALDVSRNVFNAQIEAHHGRVVDMAGDSVLAIFDSATAAVNTALAVQAKLTVAFAAVHEEQRMRFRIGVHLGDVLERTDGTIYGDGVNITARLQALAEAGGIAVSDAVFGAVCGKVAAVRFDDQGERAVKNLPRPLKAYCVRHDPTGAMRPMR